MYSAVREREREGKTIYTSFWFESFSLEFFFKASLASGSVHKPWGFTAGRAPGDKLQTVLSRTVSDVPEIIRELLRFLVQYVFLSRKSTPDTSIQPTS